MELGMLHNNFNTIHETIMKKLQKYFLLTFCSNFSIKCILESGVWMGDYASCPTLIGKTVEKIPHKGHF